MPVSPLDTFPGWRPDPSAPDCERFWNGMAWTDKTRPIERDAGTRTAAREINTPDGISIRAEAPAAALSSEPAPAVTASPAPPLIAPHPGPTEATPPMAASGSSADTEPRSIFLDSDEEAPSQVTRRVQVASGGTKRASRSSSRRGRRPAIVALLCLVIGAGAGFAAGYVLGSDDTGSVDPAPAADE